MPTYSKNFLTRVICRVDYSTILRLREQEPAQFQERIRQNYPRVSRERGIQIDFQADPPTAHAPVPPAWVFEDTSRQDKVTLTSDFLAYEAKAYIDFPDFSSKFSPVYTAFIDTYTPSIVNRIGLRYINEIYLPNGNPFEWDDFINNHLTASLQAFPDNQRSISRSMHKLDLNKEHCQMTFHFGVYNSEYPNTITRKEFILDYDCVSRDERSPGEVLGMLGTFNEEIEKLFEASIGDGLREIMRRDN